MISINGSINCTSGSCQHLDALLVKYYDPDVDPDYAYHSTSVSVSGSFVDEIDSPTGFFILIKLFVVNRDGSETLVVSEQFEALPELNPVFEYDESQYSYASNIEVTSTGTVTPVSTPCNSLDKLLVKFFDGYAAAGSGSFATAYVDSGGNYNKQITLPTRSVVAELYVGNRDGSETLVESKTTYYETGDLRINFSYNELNFSYAQPLIAITGLVTPAQVPCNSLDKLKVYYLDGYDPSPGAFANHLVDAGGEFSGSIQATSRSVIAKLYVVNVDTTETLVESKNFYCPDNDETINFNYDESLYSYSNSNNNNMGINVKGVVTSTTNEYFTCIDVSQLTVKFYTVGFNSLSQIGTTATTVNANGTFTFNLPDGTNSIKVKLFLNGTEIAISGLICIKGEVEIDFDIDESKHGSPVYNKIITRLSATGVATNQISSLTDAQIEDLSCIACVSKSGLSRIREAFMLWDDLLAYDESGSSSYSSDLTLFEEFRNAGTIERGTTIIFGLLKYLSTTIQDVFAFSRNQFKSYLQQCINLNEIANGSASDSNLNLLEACRTILLLNSEDGGKYLEARFIHLTSANAANKKLMLNSFFEENGFDMMIRNNSFPTNDLKNEIISIRTLGGHLLNYTPFMKEVVDTWGTNFDYYQLTLDGPSAWSGFSGGHPPQYSSSAEYHQAVFLSIAEVQPSARLARSLSTSGIANAGAIYDILTDGNNRNFNLKEQGTNDFFVVKSTPDPDKPEEVTREMLDKIQAFQRVAKLTMENDSLIVSKALLESQMHSAYSISKKGRVLFMELMADKSVPAGVAEVIYDRARGLFETFTLWAVQHKRYDSPNANLPLAARGSGAYEKGGSAANDLPDLELLFGTFNTCECSQCQSVYSPAAYLTDLLNWLSKDIGTDSNYTTKSVAFDCLMEKYDTSLSSFIDRRKDIEQILLCCENTNTLIPYIDIINELLTASISYNVLVGPPDYSYMQTTKTTEEVLVEPEHRKPGIEAYLDTVYYPWTLPYNGAHHESEVYLKELNSPYPELIKAFSKNSELYNQDGNYSATNPISNTSTFRIPWAEAYLELSPSEFYLIDGTKTSVASFWKVFWGLNLSGSNTPKVSPAMKAAGLSFDELKDLLNASFIESSTKIKAQPDSADLCDFDKYSFSPALTIDRADHFMRFLRLKRKANVSTLELDLAIKNLSAGGNTLNSAFIEKFTSALAFCRKHGLSFLEHQVWFSSLAYTEIWNSNASGYYNTKFRNPLFSDKIIDFFDPVPTTGNYIFAVSSLTIEHKQMLSSTLKISIPHIDFLLGHLSTTLPLNKTKLAKIESYAGLINVFNLTAQEIGSVFRLIGDPLNTTTFPNTLKAVWDFETNLTRLRELKTDPNEMVDIIEGTGYYALNATTGEAVNLKFDKEAEDCWKNVEFAFQEAIKANPEKSFSSTTPWMPVVTPTDTQFYRNVVISHFILPFRINLSNANTIIAWYDVDNSPSTWLDDYIKDPFVKQGAGYERTWTNNTRNIKGKFTKLYRLFKRIQLISDICRLDESGINYAVNAATNPTSFPLPGTPFYWIRSTFTATNTNAHVFKLFWINEAVKQAETLQLYVAPANPLLPAKTFQQLYFEEATLYYQYGTPSPTVVYVQTDIANLYDKIGEKSSYKQFSKQEFIELFQRAENKRDVVDDIIDIIQKAEHFATATQNLNIKFIDAWSWVWANSAGSSISPLDTYCPDIRRVLNTHYPQFNSWSDLIVPIQNDFRVKLRDALVAYHIGELGYEDDNELYAYFLLDTQMSPCMMISRVVAAINSVQLLIHRSLLGLEPEIFMDDTDKKEWQWRKNYRVWEANRKVFLYPENWIDPTLRLNKSYLFKEAEDLLQQDDINAYTTEQAYAGYLQGLNEIAKLDVRAVYNEYTNKTPGDAWSGWNTYTPNEFLITHVFARTWNSPHLYYHRVFSGGRWSAWEKIDVEIDSEHLIPTVFNRKLYVYFPIFIEKIYDDDKDRKYYEVKLCYIKYDQGKWSNKKIMNDKLLAGKIAYHNLDNNEENLKYITAKAVSNPAELNVSTINAATPEKYTIRINNYNGNKYLYWVNVASGISNDGRLELHFSLVGLDKKNFYFWAQMKSDGDLIIHVRRAPNSASDLLGNTSNLNTDFAYESSFLISAVDERLKIIPPVSTDNGNGPYLIGRPDNSLPYYQQILGNKNGNGTLYVRPNYTSQNMPLLTSAPGKHVITYPDQYKDAYYYTPFFYSDDRHSFVVKPSGTYYYFNMDYDFILNEHPFVNKMLRALNVSGVEGLLASNDIFLERQAEIQNHPYKLNQTDNGAYFTATLNYNPTWIVNPLPALEYDFSQGGTYSIYNWEVFFHSVSLIARQLKQNNKFAEAFKWLSYIFDPNNRDMALADTRYWKIKPFLIDVSDGSIQKMMRTLAAGPTSPYYDQTEKDNIISQITAWRNNPFDPHLIAGMRPRAYMLWTVMEFIDNLIEWADSLFRQDTMESINEAQNLYIVASELLGKRPVKVYRPEPDCKSFSEIKGEVDPFSNLFVEFENYAVTVDGPVWVKEGIGGIVYGPDGLPYCVPEGGTSVSSGSGLGGGTTSSISITDLYYCIPDNPKLTALWDKVEDRLFKIRHCMNIDGKLRQLALFSAPIDPAMLVQAVAAGLSVEDALANFAAPMPHYRFSYLLQKANEFNNEVKGLGSQLLGLLEKKDAEELSLFRQVHEQNILKASRNLKLMAIEEAKQNLATLQSSKNLIQIRLDDYRNREYTNSRELASQAFTKKAENLGTAEQSVRALAGLLNLIPEVYVGGVPPYTMGFGGSKISTLVSAGANVIGIYSTINRNKASMSVTFAGYDRRQEDWDLQIKTATEELAQVDRQILSSEIRIAITEKELENHDLQVSQSEEMYEWLKSKYTNGKLYSWMSGQIKSVYKKVFNLAFDMSKRAQICMDRELGTTGSNFIQYGQWDSSKSGFLAGERLGLQLKQLENYYIENNSRELELSKNISLALLNPKALEDLIIKGYCTFQLPEFLFDLDHPGQYFRRIKSVSISIPCIAGPNTNINAILSLSGASIRTDKNPTTYSALPINSTQLESIATSSGQNDSGVFELNFKDERYLPFEGKGAVSEWTLELSQISRTAASKEAIRQFDFETISDVVVHMKYTARYDGGLAGKAKTYILNNLTNLSTDTFGKSVYHMFSLRHDIPNAWHQFVQNGNTNFKIEKNRLPYIIQLLDPKVKAIELIVQPKAYTGTKNLTFSCSASGATFSTNAFPDYAGAVDVAVPMRASQTYTSAVSAGLDLNIATVNPASGDIDDIIVIAQIALS